MGIEKIGNKTPCIPKDPNKIYIHPSAIIAGEVSIAEESSIWCNAVIRGDLCRIEIGKRCNIQDGVVIHVGGGIAIDPQDSPTILGDNVTVGHLALVHGCVVGDNTLIGMGSIVMSRSVIGKNCIVGAGSLITEGKIIPDGSLVFGSPAKVIRSLTQEEIESNHRIAEHYWMTAFEMGN